jgi:hypothetical protein
VNEVFSEPSAPVAKVAAGFGRATGVVGVAVLDSLDDEDDVDSVEGDDEVPAFFVSFELQAGRSQRTCRRPQERI